MISGGQTVVRSLGMNNPLRQMRALLLCLALVAASCSGSTQITDSSLATPVQPTASEPTAVAESGEATEPTAVPSEPEAAEAAPTAEPIPAGQPAEFRDDSVLAIADGGRFAYGGTTSPWNTPTSCDAAPTESVAVLSIREALRGNVAAVGAGLEQAGDVRQMLVGSGAARDQVAFVLSCESSAGSALWLQHAMVGPDGRFVGLSEPLEFGSQPGESDPFLLRWVDNETIEARVIVEIDPDDYESWTIERRQISVRTGQITTVQVFDFSDDDGFGTGSELTIQGFTYRAMNDPGGALGCEGAGIARTIEVDDGNQRRPALGLDGPVFSDVGDLHASPTGHIAWTSGCEGYLSAYVGKITDDGSIADAHHIAQLPSDGLFADYLAYRLTDDGFLAAVGVNYSNDGNDRNLVFQRYDLSSDPHFVNTADPAPAIDQSPLFQAIDGVSSWHVGDTLAASPACGGRTLYAKTSTGFVRAFETHTELDAIVDADAAGVRTIQYEDGTDFNSRTVVVQTECPGEYEGRRVWFGIETDSVQWGISFGQLDLGSVSEVADVLSVRDELQEGTDFLQSSFVEVELLDGTVAEFELIALPRS